MILNLLNLNSTKTDLILLICAIPIRAKSSGNRIGMRNRFTRRIKLSISKYQPQQTIIRPTFYASCLLRYWVGM